MLSIQLLLSTAKQNFLPHVEVPLCRSEFEPIFFMSGTVSLVAMLPPSGSNPRQKMRGGGGGAALQAFLPPFSLTHSFSWHCDIDRD